MDAENLAEIVRSHRLWLRGEEGGKRANLTRANLAGANLAGADLAGADLTHAYLAGAYLAGANLTRAYLAGANLAGANLAGANLTGANLAGANLAGANPTRAYLAGADLRGANLAGATMPDGRPWEAYRADHLAGICSEPEVVARAVAAWGTHEWSGCPMHAALGIDGFGDIDDTERRRLVACWVALYDANLIDVSGVR